MILLETLPGWPEAEPLSGLYYWFLLFIGPVALSAVIAAIVLAKGWLDKK